MKSKFLFFFGFVLIAVAILPFLRSRTTTPEWNRDSSNALEQARSEGKPVLVFLYTDWCTYCKQMDGKTFSDPNVIDELGRKFVWLRLNAETDAQGIEMQRRFGISGFPTILFLDPSGRELNRIAGFVPPDQFRGRVEAIMGNSGI
jgi:thiol:disulfide interchange protein